MATNRLRTEVLIIGTGLAGCTCALTLADAGFEVLLITPTDKPEKGNSALAQGGIIFSTNPKDQDLLEKDIHIAGHNINSTKAVQFLVKKGHEWVQNLLIDRLQIPFEKDKNGNFTFTKEGGHSSARIVHCHDYTGKAIMDGLLKEIEKHKNIKIYSKHCAIDLITTEHHSSLTEYRYQLKNECLGAYVLDEEKQYVEIILANHTILATGGIGQVYLHSTNNYHSVGSAISMAQRAGARLMNIEHVQFHPTSLWDLGSQSLNSQRFLITEAMRGEGAVLRNKAGKAFMADYDSRKDLAPRDVVAKAIVTEMLKTEEKYVNLDTSNIKEDIAIRFPTIYNHCIEHNVDLSKGLIPVVPAAHYFCGGILTNLDGCTSLNRLFAIGECACTGVHGKNRLASTSLLEAVLWGGSSAEYIINSKNSKDILNQEILDSIPDWENKSNENNDDPALIAADWAQIKTIMWNYMGIIRTKQKVRRAFEELRDLSKHIHDFYKNTAITSPLIRLFHGAQTAYIITQSALRNTSNKD